MRLQTLLAELKRRKVMRVAAAYGATAFVLLQVADITFPALRLPGWAMTLVVALAIIGFPMALVLAWTFESTGEGLRRTAPPRAGELEAILALPRARRWPAGIAALLGVVLLGAGTAWALGHDSRRSAGYDSIAVLPFANLSGDVENEYFGDGLAEELLNALAGIEGLKVAARTSAFAFKGSSMDVRQIGDTLGVATVLEGSVRRSAERVRITAQLIDARTGYHLWSETYDRPLTDLFAVQDALSREIVDALASRFARTGRGELYHGGTADVEAYDLYLLGRQKWVTRQVPLLREAVEHFEAAIARDSSFALAWSGLADAIDALAWRTPDALARVPEAKFAAQRAVLLDPDLAEGWASIGVLALDYDRDFRTAELALRRSVALRPSNAAVHHWLGDALRYSGRVEEALTVTERAVELDPVNTQALGGLLQTLMVLERWPEARAVADRMVGTGVDIGTRARLIWAGAQLGYTADELAAFTVEWARVRAYSRPEETAVVGRAIVDPALRRDALPVLQKLEAEGVNARDMAALFMALGDPESALASLERGVAVGEPILVTIRTDGIFKPLRTDPRFVRILERLGLPSNR